MRADSRLQGAMGLGTIVLCLWLLGVLAPFCHQRRPNPGAPASTPTQPILLSDVPPAPVVTVASGNHGGSRWSLVVSANDDLRCFGLSVEMTSHHGYACNHGTLGRGKAFGGTVFAPSELTRPLIAGEVAPSVSAVEVVWRESNGTRARVAELSRPIDAGVKYFVSLLPPGIQRLHLLALDAGSRVIDRRRVCCPPSGIRHPPIVPLCHGMPTPDLRARDGAGERSALEELTACPAVDLVTGVEFVASY